MIMNMAMNLKVQGTNKRVVRDRLIQICKSVLHYMAAIGWFSKSSLQMMNILS